ncbi:MAG: DUF134 domain-containing protein [Deltaproteobacteria bacterium]|nr:DUF134 domain-containing protein [Deltaproteobacteria bacterium]
MSRPKKNRQVLCSPDSLYFKPRAIPLRALEETVLADDELESLRLADLYGLYHKEAAVRMQISRQTFGNILKSGRKKVADALVNGKAIRIQCEAFSNAFICDDCAHIWKFEDLAGRPDACPHCSGEKIYPLPL